MTDRAVPRMSHLTSEQRAELVRRLRSKRDDEPTLAPRPGPRERFPLGLDQERLWLLEQLNPNSTTYNISVGLRFRGPLDVAALQEAAGDVVRRHELLRSTLHSDGGDPYLRVRRDLPPEFATADLRHVPADEREDALADRIRAHTGEGFDLETGPLLRILVVCVGSDDYQIVETMHHAVTDQWSYLRLNAELVEHYRARTEGRTPEVPELPVQFGDFAIWQRRWFTGDRRERIRAFWRTALREAPPLLELPYDASPYTADRAGAHHYFVVRQDVSAAFMQLARNARTTIATALMAVYAELLYEETGQRDLVIGVPSATRRPETKDLIGFFLTNVPIRLQVPESASPRQLLDVASRASAAVAEHLDVPFSEIVEALAPDRSLHRYPLLQTMHLVLDFEESIFDVPGAEVYGTEVEDGVSPMDITVGWWRAGDTLYGRFEYRTALFHQSTVERLANRLLELVEQFVDAPDRPFPPRPERSPSTVGTAPGAPAALDRPAVAAPPAALQQVYTAWAAVLGAEPVAPDMSFFDAGGTSLQAFRLAHELREAGLEASTRDVFVFPKAASLAATLAGRLDDHDHAAVADPDGVLSPEQEDLLAFESARPERWAHSVVLTAAEALDPELMRAALDSCARAHPALTACFRHEDGDMRMRPGVDWLWSVEPDDAEDNRVIGDHLDRLDLGAGRLFAASLIPAGAAPRLVLTANHLVVDGFSWALLVADLAAAYRGEKIPPERGSYVAYSAAVRQMDFSAELPYWRSQVTDQQAGASPEDGGRLEDEREVVVEALCPAAGPVVQEAALACVARGIARLTGHSTDSVVDVVGLGREPIGDPFTYDLARGVGYFACSYPLRLPVDLERDAVDDVISTAAALRSVPNGGKGWGALITSPNPAIRAQLAGLSRPIASFNYVGSSTALHEVSSGLFTATAEHGRGGYVGARRDHEIGVTVAAEGDRLILRWQYNAERFSGARIASVASRVAAELSAAMAALARTSGGGGMSLGEVNALFAELHRQSR